MTRPRSIKNGFRRLWAKDVVRYWVVANICAIADLSLFWFLTVPLELHYLASATISWVLGMALNYSLCVLWVFESGARFDRRKEIMALYIVSIGGLAIHHGALWIYLNQFGLGLIPAKIFAMFTMFFWNYFGRKYWVFKDNPVVDIEDD